MAAWRSVNLHFQPPAKCPVRGKGTFRAASLPPPNLSGSAASNPRSTFNPLVLAYLGDAVWEAHTRRVEIELEARTARLEQYQQQQEGLSQRSSRQGPGSSGSTCGRNGTRATGRQQDGGRQVTNRGGRQATNPQVASKSSAPTATAMGIAPSPSSVSATAPIATAAATPTVAALASGVTSADFLASMNISREDRKRWSTATFQALVFDALMGGGLPAPPLGFPSAADTAGAMGITVTSNDPPTNEDNANTIPTTTTTKAAVATTTITHTLTTTSVATAPCVESHTPLPSSLPPGSSHTAPATSEPVVLRPEELEVLRWGRNAGVRNVPRDVAAGEYKKATAVEVLVAHLYLTAPARCAQLVTAAVAAPLLTRKVAGSTDLGESTTTVR